MFGKRHVADLTCAQEVGEGPLERVWSMTASERVRGYEEAHLMSASGAGAYAEGRVAKSHLRCEGEVQRKGGFFEVGSFGLEYRELAPRPGG